MDLLLLSIGGVFLLCTVAYLACTARIEAIRVENRVRRKAFFEKLGVIDQKSKRIVGFFHPYCNAGGGGERVLWGAIAFMQRTQPDVLSVVYTGDTDATKEQILAKVKAGFDIELSPSSVDFVYLKRRYLVEDKTWPRFTMLGQSIGSMFLAWEAMSKLIPDLYIDSMGYAFTFHIVKLVGGVPIGTYTHYPTISRNMLARVSSRQHSHTNPDFVASSTIRSQVKLLYYRLFMYYYSYSLRQASFIMVNSSWTKGHIDFALRHRDMILDVIHLCTPLALMTFPALRDPTRVPLSSASVVYPPCDAHEMAQFPLKDRERVILSLAQFRPEKDHQAQLYAFQKLLKDHPEYSSATLRIRLVLIGGSRNEGDAARVAGLKELAKKLAIEDQTEFIVNASYPDVLKWLSRASIGLSTMVDEHFGINVVELMAAGVIPVTHASGGPLNDIVVPYNGQPTGYHATSTETFAGALHEAFTLSKKEELDMRVRARTWAVHRFSAEQFEKGWDESGWKSWLR